MARLDRSTQWLSAHLTNMYAKGCIGIIYSTPYTTAMDAPAAMMTIAPNNCIAKRDAKSCGVTR